MTADSGSALIIGVDSPVVGMVALVPEVFSSRAGGTNGGMQNADGLKNGNIRCRLYSYGGLS